MPGQVTLVAVIVLLLGTILGYFVGLRAVQASRRLANFRLRQGEVRRARVAFAAGTLLAMLSVVVLATGQRSGGIPASVPPSVTLALTAPATASSVPTVWFPPSSTATFFSLTATPAASATAPATQRPALPISIEAIFQGTVTPGADLGIGTLRFSTEMKGSQPVGPGNRFRNPIKRMFSVFSYQNMRPGTQWTVLWYVNGELKYFETKVWDKAPSGLSFAVWEQPVEKWLPGTYEVHIYAGSEWKASGSFALSGEPPTSTATRTASASPTASQVPSATATRTPVATHTPKSTATASRTATPPRPLPSPEASSSTPSGTPVPTASPTASLTAPVTPSAAASATIAPTAMPTITRTVTASVTPRPPASPTATLTASPTATWTATATGTPATTTVRIYFTNSRRLANRTPPFEEGVLRQISSSANLISAALDGYFTGPNAVEQSRGLSAVWNGFIGYRRAEFSKGTLHVHLIGYCRSSGGGYSIATPLFLTLKQFPGVNHVKLYDEYERTHDATGENDSAPDCISVPFTPIPSSTPTRTPTRTPRPPTLTATALPSPTASPRPSATVTLLPSGTATPPPSPTATVPAATRTASRTSVPTSTRVPTRTPSPTVTATVRPSSTPTLATVQVGIYFTDLQKLRRRTPPFEELVVREVPSSMNPVVAVLDEYFRGPSAEEQSRGLSAVWNGFVGYRRADFSNGMLEIYLAGRCESSLTGYSIAQPLTASLKKIPGVRYVKLYDQYDRTRDPLSEGDSAPACLLATATPPPSLTPTPTPLPTRTPTKSPTPVPPTHTPRPTETATRPPTMTATIPPPLTPTRTLPPSQTPTQSPMPTNSPTARPSSTPTALPTATRIPTRTPAPTATPFPTRTPTGSPSSTPTALPSSTWTASAAPTRTASRTPIVRPTFTASPTRTLTATVTQAPSATTTNTALPTQTPEPPTATSTNVPPTATKSPIPPPTATRTASTTPSPSATWTMSPIPTATKSPTPPPTATRTASLTPRPSGTWTVSPAPTATRTPTPSPTASRTASPTATLKPSATWTAVPTATATRTRTPAATASTPADCNRAAFVGDVTIRDLETIPAGGPFTKTWRIKNEGTCTWTTAYRLIFVAGTPMNTPNWIALPGPVTPGQMINLSVNLVAPAAPGRYEGYWMLQTPAGIIFGVGRSSDQPVWVKIRVISAPARSQTPTATSTATPEGTSTAVPPTSTPADLDLHLAVSACEAQWATSAGELPCPGSGADGAGSVLPLGQASLEGGSTGGPALMIVLPAVTDAYVQGIFPEREVQAGDRLQATVGCAEDAASCSVLFRAGYQNEAGQTHELWSIGEFYDEKVFELDLDLSPLAGQKARFILGVSSLGPAEGDRAIWVDPRVMSSSPAPTATPPEATPSPTPGQPTPSVSPPPIPSATPAAPTGNPGPLNALQRLLDAIASFIRQLFGG